MHNAVRGKAIAGGAVWLFSLLLLAIAVPGLIVKKMPGHTGLEHAHPPQAAEAAQPDQPIMVPVYLTEAKKVVNIPLEEYVRGVLAAEVPADFELEALKAQAMAARTYVVKRMVEWDRSNVPVRDAVVTDSAIHQVFVGADDLPNLWPASKADANLDKLTRAVRETRDLILTYDGRPINATFFSTSNGYTENSEDYWSDYTPYLRSVPSPWDARLSPRYKETVSLDAGEVMRKLGVGALAPSQAGASGMKVLERTQGGRIKTISIGNRTFTGREVREKLGLNSTHFEWKWNGNRIEFTTYGYGHGVGMSQWGANGMAKEGKTAEEIVKHYYTGIDISHSSQLLAVEIKK